MSLSIYKPTYNKNMNKFLILTTNLGGKDNLIDPPKNN